MMSGPFTHAPNQASVIEEVAQMNSTELVNMLNTDEFGSAIDTGLLHEPGPAANSSQPIANVPPNFIPPHPMRFIPQTSEPYVEVIEQPKSRALRFRYQCEGRSAGSIAGEKSRPEKKTSPTIKIHNYQGPLIAVVSCVTNENKPKPHPHSLVGTDCTKGVCTVKVKDRTTIPFSHLGIQCARKKDIEDFLKVRKDINVDPFQTGFDHINKSIDLNVVKLCFQVFLPDKNGKFTRILKPICSNAIFDKKVVNDLSISRIDKVSGRARGGDEVFLLCDKIVKDDIVVLFQEYHPTTKESIWESFGEFGGADVHKQHAIVFKTPPYREVHTKYPVEVELKLKRPSDGETSTPINFVYMPEDPDQFHIIEKKKRKMQLYEPLIHETLPSTVLNADIKEKLRAKATRKIKTERGVDLGEMVAAQPTLTTLLQTLNTLPHAATVMSNNYEQPSVSNWLNNFTATCLPLPTQVTSTDHQEPQFTTLQLADLYPGADLDGYNFVPNDAVISLGEISSGDLFKTSLDPPMGAMENISSDL